MRLSRSKILKKGYQYRVNTVKKYYFEMPVMNIKHNIKNPKEINELTARVYPNTIDFYDGKYGWAYICKETNDVLDASITIKFRGIDFYLELLDKSFVLWCKTPDGKHAFFASNKEKMNLIPVSNPKYYISKYMLYAVLCNPNIEYGKYHKLIREKVLNMLKNMEE